MDRGAQAQFDHRREALEIVPFRAAADVHVLNAKESVHGFAYSCSFDCSFGQSAVRMPGRRHTKGPIALLEGSGVFWKKLSEHMSGKIRACSVFLGASVSLVFFDKTNMVKPSLRRGSSSVRLHYRRA